MTFLLQVLGAFFGLMLLAIILGCVGMWLAFRKPRDEDSG